MAFGFHRAPDTSRGYVNDSNPDFAPGQRLSRRQYDRYVEKLGQRTHLPGTEAIRATSEELADLQRQLEAEELDPEEFQLAAQELQARRRELEVTHPRLGRQGAGQRRYNAALDAYVQEQRRRGRKINKREAGRSAEFKQIMADLKGKPNKRGNPMVRDQNRFLRRKALDQLGGDQVFRNQYESLYGGARGGHGFRVNRKGRSIMPRRRAA